MFDWQTQGFPFQGHAKSCSPSPESTSFTSQHGGLGRQSAIEESLILVSSDTGRDDHGLFEAGRGQLEEGETVEQAV
jgi:hypothetical protein